MENLRLSNRKVSSGNILSDFGGNFNKERRLSKITKMSRRRSEIKGLSKKNQEIMRRVIMQVKILNYLRKPKKTKNKMKKSLMKLGIIGDIEKRVTRQRKDDYYDVDNFNDLEDVIHKFLENKLDPTQNSKVVLTIYPNSTFKKIWDMLIVFILIYICTVFPYRICFLGVSDSIELDALFWLDVAIDFIFFVDIILNFFFALEKEGVIIDKKKQIAVIYMTSWFLPDLVSIIPFYLLSDESSHGMRGSDRSFLKILKFFRLLKLVRIFKGNPVFDRIMFNLKLSVVTKQILKNLLFLVFFIHFIGCIWHYLGNFGSPKTSWLYPIGLYDADNFTKYLSSIYFALVVSFTVGYGDITPISHTETMFVVFYLIIGVSLYSYTISNLTSLFGRLSERDNYLQEKENAIKMFAMNHNLSPELYMEIRNYLIDNDTKQTNFLFEKNLISNINDLTEFLPKKLYFELYVNNFKKQLKQLPMLRNIDDKFYLAFISIFEIRLFNKNDIVFKPGDPVEQVYIVWKGRFVMTNSLNFESYEEYQEEKKRALYNINGLGNKGTLGSTNQKLNEKHSYAPNRRRKIQEEMLKIMTYFNSGDMIGENDLKKCEGGTRKFTLRAKKDSVVIVLNKNDIKYLCDLDYNFKSFYETSQKKKESVIRLIFDSLQRKAKIIKGIKPEEVKTHKDSNKKISEFRQSVTKNYNKILTKMLNHEDLELENSKLKLTLANRLFSIKSPSNKHKHIDESDCLTENTKEREELLRLLMDNKDYEFLQRIAPIEESIETKNNNKIGKNKFFSSKSDGDWYDKEENDNDLEGNIIIESRNRKYVMKLLNPENSNLHIVHYPSPRKYTNLSHSKISIANKSRIGAPSLSKILQECSFHSESDISMIKNKEGTVITRLTNRRNVSKKEIKKEKEKHDVWNYSMIDLPVKINLDNFDLKMKNIKELNRQFNLRLLKLVKQKKFQVIKPDIFPIIHSLNMKLKEIFEVMRNFIYQFEEVRRKFSVNTPDTIREAKQSINDSFSIFYEIIEILNKLRTVDLNENLEMMSEYTQQAVKIFEQRFEDILRRINN